MMQHMPEFLQTAAYPYKETQISRKIKLESQSDRQTDRQTKRRLNRRSSQAHRNSYAVES